MINEQYDTIRNTVKRTGFTQNFIRGLVAQGKCPGFYSGNRFYVNIPKFLEQMEQANNINFLELITKPAERKIEK